MDWALSAKDQLSNVSMKPGVLGEHIWVVWHQKPARCGLPAVKARQPLPMPLWRAEWQTYLILLSLHLRC
jgi:hypothetical protein